MTDQTHLVSIVTPCYNCKNFIGETINSVFNQTYDNWELIITDDCSKDGSEQLIREITRNDSRVKYFRFINNSGAGVARNNSIKEAKGRFIAFCDSDDQWKPNKLEKQIDFMLKNNYSLTYTSYDVINESGKFFNTVNAKQKVSYLTMLKNNYIGCLTAIYDSDKLGKMYMPEIRKRQDWALWLSILKHEKWAYGINESLAIYRDRSKSISSSKIEMLKYNWQIYNDIENISFTRSIFLMIQFLYYYFLKRI